MNYRKEIAEMLDKIQSEKILRYIYLIIADIPKKVLEVIFMNYKKEIIEMMEKITKTENISMLYGVVKTMVEYEDQKEKKQGKAE